VLVLRHLTMRYWSQRRTAAPLKPIPTETAVKRVSVLDRPRRREAARGHCGIQNCARPAPLVLNEHYDGDGEIVFKYVRKLGCEGIV
jgi:hypothetical protein